MPRAKRRLLVRYPGSGLLPKGFPVLEYRNGLKFYEGDVWVRPPETSPEIERTLVDRGYLREETIG